MQNEDDSIKILKQRYAKGEITKREYNQMKEDLGIEKEPTETRERPEPKRTTNKDMAGSSSLLGNKKLLIAIGIIVIISIVGWIYAGSTPARIVADAPSYVLGNNTAVNIPVTVYNLLGGTIDNGQVTAQTNVGSAQSCSIAPDYTYCNISFNPGTQSTPTTAQISFSYGGISQQATVSVTALTYLSLKSGSTQLYNNNLASTTFPAGIFANPNSPFNLTVTAYDNNNNPAPTRVNFSIQTSGSYASSGSTLSSSYCVTKNGGCSITVMPSANPGNLSIVVSAGKLNLNVPIVSASSGYNVTFTPSTYSIQRGGSITLNGAVKYLSNLQGAYNVSIFFFIVNNSYICTGPGGICFNQGQSVSAIGFCNSNLQGKCSISYTAPSSSGTVNIAAGAYPWPGYNGKYSGTVNGDCAAFKCPGYVLNSGQQTGVSYPTYTNYDAISVT